MIKVIDLGTVVVKTRDPKFKHIYFKFCSSFYYRFIFKLFIFRFIIV